MDTTYTVELTPEGRIGCHWAVNIDKGGDWFGMQVSGWRFTKRGARRTAERTARRLRVEDQGPTIQYEAPR